MAVYMSYPPPHQASRLALAAQVSLASYFLLEDPLGTADLKQAPAPQAHTPLLPASVCLLK